VTDPGAPLTRRAAREASKAAPAKAPRIDPQTGEELPPSGIAALIARHPRAWIASAAAVAFLLLATGAVAAGIAAGGKPAAATVTPEGKVITARDLPEVAPASSHVRTCSVGELATDARLGKLRATVIDATTGDVLYDHGGSKPARPASVLKTLTASAALMQLGADYRFTTKVVEGSAEGTIVLVGGGDSTLTRVETGDSYYKGAAKLSTLAAQVVAAYAVSHPEVPITTIVLDSSYWNPADNWVSSWADSNRTLGYQGKVTALQVDGDRNDPTQRFSPRSSDPVKRAGTAFAAAIAAASGQPAATLTIGTAASTVELGSVQSQPLSTLINQMLLTSDGTIAEMLGRVTALKMGLDGSSASVGQAISSSMGTLGLDATTLTIVDGSGLSPKNAVSPAFMTQFMALARAGGDDLNYVYNSLSVAGETGGLKERFTSSDVTGNLVAKTGHISNATTLAGVVDAADGTTLAFAFYALDDNIGDGAVAAIDALANGISACGANLAAY
jgi:D-alanyl-D-alanine carboxypeptidase/D-alanyl-D-alanine-endopeptidase (penicillin-binding protein 4)